MPRINSRKNTLELQHHIWIGLNGHKVPQQVFVNKREKTLIWFKKNTKILAKGENSELKKCSILRINKIQYMKILRNPFPKYISIIFVLEYSGVTPKDNTFITDSTFIFKICL